MRLRLCYYQIVELASDGGRTGGIIMSAVNQNIFATNRRRLLQSAIMAGGMAAAFPAWADGFVELALPGGPDRRDLTTDFPEKKSMILQRSRPPLLETPFEVFDHTPFGQRRLSRSWAHVPRRYQGGRNQQQLPCLPFRRHGADPTGLVPRRVAKRSREDAQHLQGAGRGVGRPSHCRLSRCAERSEIGGG